jgi:putative DNA-invertase from lambdoid prophage Rac
MVGLVLWRLPTRSKSVNTAIYARVSTSDQDCGLQLTELREYCQRRGWPVHREYVDAGISGAKASRPALDRLMADAAQHKFDVVVCYKLDRFSRSVLHLNQQLAALEANSVGFISTSQGLDTDQANPTSRLLVQILGAVGQFERELILERVASGIAQAKHKGVKFGRPSRIFRRDEAVRMREEGLSYRQIAKALDVPVMTVVDAVRKPVSQIATAPAANVAGDDAEISRTGT